MLSSILFIVFVILFCLKSKKEYIICLLIILLPFHEFISSLLKFWSGSSGLFPVWRDICSLILFCKVFIGKNKVSNNKDINNIIFITIIYITFMLMLYFGKYEKGISFYRIYIDVLLIIYTFNQIKLSEKAYKRISNTFIYTSLFVCISGFIQYFILREYLHIIFNHYELNSMGKLVFKSPSWTIMGYERMAGFVGSPNNFGVYLAISIFICYVMQANKKSILVTLCFLLSCVCLLLSFSRAGWGIALSSIFIYQYRKYGIKKIAPMIIYIIGTIFSFLLLGYIIFPESFDIILGTFNGEETSAASRSRMVQESYNQLLESFFGNGIGSTDNETGIFFAESSLLNIIFELGIQGGILWYLILIIASIKCYKKKHTTSNIAFSFIIPSILVSIASVNIMTWPFIYYLYAIAGLGINKNRIIPSTK